MRVQSVIVFFSIVLFYNSCKNQEEAQYTQAEITEASASLNSWFDTKFDEDVAESSVVKAAINRVGGDVGKYLAAADDSNIQEILVRNSNQSVKKGVFGVPSYVVGDEVFWGQDRLDFLDAFLKYKLG